MAKLDNQLARMQSLMTYGTVTENKNIVSKNFETRMLGADGKSYAVIRENAKYYIKTAPAEKASILESYDYIGGWANRKDYEYSSYSNALKNFELKLRSLNEAYDAQVTIETLDPFKKEDLVIEGTDAMKNQIARMRQIMHNTAAILNESSTIGKTPITNQPESKHANSGDKDAPFTEPAHYEENRDGKKTSRKEIDKDNSKAHADNGEKDTKHTGKRGDEGYKKVSDDLKGNGVAAKKTKGGYKQPKNLSEGCCGNCEAENGVVSDCMKDWGRVEGHSEATMWDEADMDEPNLNEENLEGNDWGSEGLGEVGTGEVGDDAPFTQAVNEGFDECGSGLYEDGEDGTSGDEQRAWELYDEKGVDWEVTDVDGSQVSAWGAIEDEDGTVYNFTATGFYNGDAGFEPDEDGVEFDGVDSYDSGEDFGDEDLMADAQDSAGELEFDDDMEGELDEEDDYELEGEDDMEGEDFEDEEMPEDDMEGEDFEDEESDADFGDEDVEDEGFEDYDSEDESIDEEDPEAVRAEIERLQGILDGLEGGEEEGEDFDDEEMPEDDMEDAEFDDEEEASVPEDGMEDEEMPEDNAAMMQEAKARFMNAIVEQAVRVLKEDKTVLHDFGKHPGYRKKVMSLPQTGQDKTEHGEDWNDESVHGEQPFGQKIGSSAPFEDAVRMITDAVVNEIKKKR